MSLKHNSGPNKLPIALRLGLYEGNSGSRKRSAWAHFGCGTHSSGSIMEVLVYEDTEPDLVQGGSFVSLFADYDNIVFDDGFDMCKSAETVEVAAQYFLMLIAEQSHVPSSHGVTYSWNLKESLRAMCVVWREYTKTTRAEQLEKAQDPTSRKDATVHAGENVEQEKILSDYDSDVSMDISEESISAATSPRRALICGHPGLLFLESARYFLAECSTTFTFIPLTSCVYAHFMYITSCIYTVGQSTESSYAVVDALFTAISSTSITMSTIRKTRSNRLRYSQTIWSITRPRQQPCPPALQSPWSPNHHSQLNQSTVAHFA
jgi:hypothetical protein